MSFRVAEKMMGMTASTWARHANPWSGWSRISILPLLAIAVWSRVWIGWWALVPVAAVLAWTWLNPRLFPPPASTDNWMSRGVLGERIWLSRRGDPALAHHRPVVAALTLTGLAAAVILLVGLALLNLPLTVGGLIGAILSKLWLVDRMVWVHRECGGAVARSEPPAGARQSERTAPDTIGDLEHPPIRLNQPDRKAAAPANESGAFAQRPDVSIWSANALEP